MFGEGLQEQSSHNHIPTTNTFFCKIDYGNFVLQTLKLFIGFIEFSYLYTTKNSESPIRSCCCMDLCTVVCFERK